MGFRWNGIHTNEIGLRAEADILPFFPEPKIVTEEVPAMDGFFDYSEFNNNGRVHYSPRDWSFRCSLEGRPGADLDWRLNTLIQMLMQHSGYLEADQCPGVRWQAIINNRVDINKVAKTLRNFNIFFRSQAFAEGFESISLSVAVAGSQTISMSNPGTWHVRSDIFLTGRANNATIGGIPVPGQGMLNNVMAWGPELAPGSNRILVEGFTGTVIFRFVPRYIWRMPK